MKWEKFKANMLTIALLLILFIAQFTHFEHRIKWLEIKISNLETAKAVENDFRVDWIISVLESEGVIKWESSYYDGDKEIKHYSIDSYEKKWISKAWKQLDMIKEYLELEVVTDPEKTYLKKKSKSKNWKDDYKPTNE